VLTVSKPVQAAKGSSSYVAAAERGVRAILAEAGGVGQLQEDAVGLLVSGVIRVMKQMGMVADEQEARSSKLENRGKKDRRSQTAATVLTAFEWIYSKNAGMWYSRVAAGDHIQKGQKIGTVGDLFGDTLETVISPVNGIVLFLTINPSVRENGLLMGIGVE
jgi:predicted deacylase